MENFIKNRSFGIIIVESVMSNYNGNPDEDNNPRTLIDGNGLMTPVCVKHRTREPLEDHSNPVWEYLKDKYQLDDEHYFIWESALKGYNVSNPLEARKEWAKLIKERGEEALIERFWDIRVFGTTALEDKKDNESYLRFKRTGCVSISPMISLLPIEIISQTITKANPLEEKLMKDNQGTIAPFGFKVARYGLFVGYYVVNPSRAHYTKTTDKDIELFKVLVDCAFSNSTSAFRSGVRVVQLIDVAHDNPLGSFNEFELYDFCKPTVVEKDNISNSLKDYSFCSMEDIQKRFPNIKVKMLKDLTR